MRIPRWRVAAAFAAASLVLAACGDAEPTADDAATDAAAADDDSNEEDIDDGDGHDAEHTAVDDHDHDDHDHAYDDHDGSDPGFEEVADPQPRLVIADAAAAVVHVVDLATEELLASLDVEAPGAALFLGSEQRIVAAVHGRGADAVRFLDPGTWAVDHGDHDHYYVSVPRLLETRLDIGTPIHTTADLGSFVVFGDDDGAARIVSEQALLDDDHLDVEVVQTGSPHHGGAVQLSADLLVISGPEPDQDGGLVDEVWVLYEGERVGTYDCPGLHGELTGRRWTAFACADRILLLEAHGDHAHSRELFYPDALGEDFRLGYLRTSPEHDIFVSSRGDRLVFADADAGELTVVELPAATATRSVVDDDGNVLVLTDDGVLHLFDLASATLLASSTDTVTIDDAEDAARFSIVGGRDRAYVPSPSEGLIHEFATNDDLRLARTLDVGGAPANLVYVGAWPQ